jgi:hypothetical protein
VPGSVGESGCFHDAAAPARNLLRACGRAADPPGDLGRDSPVASEGQQGSSAGRGRLRWSGSRWPERLRWLRASVGRTHGGAAPREPRSWTPTPPTAAGARGRGAGGGSRTVGRRTRALRVSAPPGPMMLRLVGLPGMFAALLVGSLSRRLSLPAMARIGVAIDALGLAVGALLASTLIGTAAASLVFVTGISMAVSAMISLFGGAAAPHPGGGMVLNGFVLFLRASSAALTTVLGLSFPVLLAGLAALLGRDLFRSPATLDVRSGEHRCAGWPRSRSGPASPAGPTRGSVPHPHRHGTPRAVRMRQTWTTP